MTDDLFDKLVPTENTEISTKNTEIFCKNTYFLYIFYDFESKIFCVLCEKLCELCGET